MAESHREEIAKLEALYASNPGGRVFVHLAEAYRKAGEHDRARRILNEGLERHADSASAYVVLGRVLADAGEDNEAQTAFRRVLELDGGNLVALRWLGDLARKSGRASEARGYYRDLLARNPHNTEIQELLSSVENATDDAEPTASAAPGRTDQDASAEPEFGIVQLDDLPGDLGAFAGISPPRAETPDETSLEEALGIELPVDEGEPEPLELEHFEAQITEEPLDETVLESSLEIETFGGGFGDEQSDVPDLPVDLSDMNAAPDEPTEEYMAGSFDLSGFEEPADEAEPETQPVDAGGLNETAEFEAPTYADDLPTLYSPDEEPEEEQADEPASIEMPFEQAAAAAAEEEAVAIEFPGEGTEDAPAETLLEAIEPEQEPATFSSEPPVDSFAQPEWEAEPATAPAADEWSETTEPETYSAEPEYTSPAEPAQPFLSNDPLQAASEALASEPITEEQWAEAGAAEAVPLEGVESAFSDVVGGAAAEEDDGLVTETMAELYRSQGFTDRAADVYRTLLRRRPGDARLANKLQELEASLEAPQVESVFEEDESGEVWLRGVGTAWTGAASPTVPEHETPYAWTQPEEAQAGEPVGSFLRSLVQWRPAHSARVSEPETQQAEPLLLDAAAEVTTPQPWTPPPASPQDSWAQTPPPPPADPWSAPPSASAPDPWAEAPAPPAADPWGAPQQEPPAPAPDPWAGQPSADPWAAPQAPPPAADPWNAQAAPQTDPWSAPTSPPASADPWAQQSPPPPPAAEPWAQQTPAADPWAQQTPAPPSAPEPWSGPAPTPEPWAAQSEPAPAPPTNTGRGASPVEAAFDAWYSPAGETPAAPTPPPAPPAPPAPAPPAAQQEEAAREGEDEDLEMFRSWLQSLKK
jgi:Tfp pilus assembly protein PilF